MDSLKKTALDFWEIIARSHDNWHRGMVTLFWELFFPGRVFGKMSWVAIPYVLANDLLNLAYVVFLTFHLAIACVLVLIVAPVLFVIVLIFLVCKTLWKRAMR